MKELPEIYELKETVENNPWHNDDIVFDHVMAVMDSLESIRLGSKASFYLNQHIDEHTRKEILFLAALYHDIAKKETIVKEEDSTSCLQHELAGSKKVLPLLDKFGLSDNEKGAVSKIIKYHGELHKILDPKNDNIFQLLEIFKKNLHDIFLELVLLGMADTMASHLRQNNLQEFGFRMNFYRKILENY